MLQEEFLQKAAQQQKLSHAYIFSGNDSVKKHRIISGFLDALKIQRTDQIHIASANGEISVGAIRDLLRGMSMTAWNSPYKTAIIQDADTMNKEAQSAFLKVLEEPKGNTIFFLLTRYPNVLLDTIRSRAQEFALYSFEYPLDPGALKNFEDLRSSHIAKKFAVAKKMAETPSDIAQTLEQWTIASRQLMIQAVEKNFAEAQKLVQTIKTIQDIFTTLQTTNTNPRLALERLMLDL